MPALLKGLSLAAVLAPLSHNRSVRGAARVQQMTQGSHFGRGVPTAFPAARWVILKVLISFIKKVKVCVHEG